MRKSFPFLFWVQLSSFEIMLPTHDQLETLVEDRLRSFQRSCKLHLSSQPPLAFLRFFESDHFFWPSWKTPWTAMPKAGMQVKQSVCFRTKTIHWMSCTSSCPTVTTHLIMDKHTPSLGVVFHSTNCLSRIRSLAIKRFFIRSFGRLDSLSSAHHFGLSSRTNLCMPPQIACLRKSCLTFGTSIICRHFIEIRDQESVLFVDSNIHLAHPNFSKLKADISTKSFLRRQPHIPQSSAGNDFRSKENALNFVELSNSTLVEKTSERLASSSCVKNGMRSLIDRNAPENTKLVGVHINKRQQIFFVSKPIWQAPRSNMQRCLRVLDNSHLNHEVLLKTPFCVWTLYFFAPQTVFFLFFQPLSPLLACVTIAITHRFFQSLIGHAKSLAV